MDSAQKKNSKSSFWEALVISAIGIHSVLLGLIIYFFTDTFYQFFFASKIENLFFVRQSGIFLFLTGLFFLYPLLDLMNYYNLILLAITAKVVAVMFLISNAEFTPAPVYIYIAALFDCLMATALIAVYFRLKKEIPFAKYRINSTKGAS